MFNLEEVRELLYDRDGFDLDCIFISKDYEFKKALIQDELKEEIINSLINRFINITNEKNVVEYDPIIKLDYAIDSICVEDVTKLNEIKDIFNNIEDIDEIQDFSEVYNSKAYAMVLKKDDTNLVFFKKFISSIYLKSKMKILWLEGRMQRFNRDILSIDDKFDCVTYIDDLLVFSKSAFEQIFDYKDEYTRKANDNIDYIDGFNIVSNIDLLREESEKVTIKKKLAKIKTENIDWFNNQLQTNFNKIEHIINTVGLDIEIVDGTLNINDVSELIHLIQNDYLKSEIDDENYVADSKIHIVKD